METRPLARKPNGNLRYGWGIAGNKDRAIKRALNELGDNAKRLAWTCTTRP